MSILPFQKFIFFWILKYKIAKHCSLQMTKQVIVITRTAMVVIKISTNNSEFQRIRTQTKNCSCLDHKYEKKNEKVNILPGRLCYDIYKNIKSQNVIFRIFQKYLFSKYFKNILSNFRKLLR